MATGHVRLRPIALPAEHGSWSFLFEPVLVGGLVAPSAGGACLAAAAAALFLARNPSRVILRARSGSTRVPVARAVAGAYAGVGAAALALAVLLAGARPLLPLLLTAPFGLVFVLLDTRNEGRSLLAELCGPLALGASAPAIALAAGWTSVGATVLYGLVVAKALPTVLYIRARLRLADGRRARRAPAVAAHALALALAAASARAGLSPWLATLAMALFLARAAHGLSPRRGALTVAQIGAIEVVMSVAFVALVVASYRA
jgi:hypothetical protein